MITGYHAGYVVDASVAMKWFTQKKETDREAALHLRSRHIQGHTRMIVPELFLLEVPNAVKAGRKGTEEELDQVLQALIDLDLQVERHSETLLRKTNAVAWAYNLTWYDAVYVALAEILGFPCITADNALLKKMKGHSIVIHLKDIGFKS